MSKVKIQGNASGTGIFTVAAPATNTDRTITLPDVDATIMTTAGGTLSNALTISEGTFGSAVVLNNTGAGGKSWNVFSTMNSFAQGGGRFMVYHTDAGSSYQLGVDSAGRVTKPYQPSFCAHAAGGTGYSANSTIVFPTVKHNTGSCYNNSTGRFTAPVSGRYLFYAQMLGDSSGNRTIAYIAMNGTTDASGQNIEISASTNVYNSAQGTTILDLVAGDYVSIKTSSGANAWYNGATFQNFFCGYLIG